MILFQSERVGCEQCIRGHRAADCSHLHKPLISIKGRGRPGNKDESLRLRIKANPEISHETEEPIESKNGKGKSGVLKRCYHLKDDTKWEYYKVRLGKGFKVIGPASPEEIFNAGQHGNFGVHATTERQGSTIHQLKKRRITNSSVDSRVGSNLSSSSPISCQFLSPVFGNTQQQGFPVLQHSESSISLQSMDDPLGSSHITELPSTSLKDQFLQFQYHSSHQGNIQQTYHRLSTSMTIPLTSGQNRKSVSSTDTVADSINESPNIFLGQDSSRPEIGGMIQAADDFSLLNNSFQEMNYFANPQLHSNINYDNTLSQEIKSESSREIFDDLFLGTGVGHINPNLI